MTEWRTIDSAPKDGTRIITFHLWTTYIQMVGISYWGSQGMYNAPAWHTYSATGAINHIDQPTHWMPLPAPPKTALPTDEAGAERPKGASEQ